ncbi:MAG: TonB-dependent receptor [Gammaproteobacteria bacterium]|nr:TonB-dependent receptor [Gammaproteobacteria bacterium]MCP5139699.1 TonB-dependent receptor [Chromatiales bacterium]
MKPIDYFNKPLLGLAAAGITLLAQPAMAIPEEIVVTARKYEESIQEIPIAVSAFTAQNIEQLNLKSIDDIAKFTPGFSFTSGFGRQPGSDRPSLRGITTVVNGVANSSAVGYFVDGIYLSGSPQATELSNLERVEIIKGPQAAQFGRGTYAGAINYITRKPSLDGLEGGATITGAEHDTQEYSGWLSGPLIDNQLAYYLSAGYDTYGGEFTNQAYGDKLGGTETKNITAKLLWTPLDGLEITLKGGMQRTDDDHFAIYLQPRTLNNCYPRTATTPRARGYYCGTAVLDENNINLATGLLEGADGGMSGAEIDRDLASLAIEYTGPSGYTFTSTTGYIADKVNTGFDNSYANYDPVPFGASAGSFYQLDEDKSETFTQELRVTTPQDARVRGTFGFYFLDIKAWEVYNRKVLSSGVSALQTIANLTTQRVQNRAVFGGIDVDINDRLTVGLEGRYSSDDVEVSNVVNDGTGTIDPCAGSSSCQKTFTSFTPRLTARYRYSDDVNLYANIARGTKPGDFNATLPNDPVSGLPDESFRAVDEETMWSYEIGAKTEWLDRRLIANFAVYFNDVEDQQLTTNIEGPGGVPQSVLANVGKTEVWGAELETNFAITDNWTAGFIYAWTHSEIKERISTDQADLVGNVTGFTTLSNYYNEFGDVSGKQSPRVPENQFALFTRYDIPFSWGSMFVGADYTFEESKYSQEHNLIETGDRNLLGARIGANWQNWQLTAWVKNLTDDDTPLDILRYIDRQASSGGALPSCTASGGTAAQCVSTSTSGRGFGLTLQPGRQVGATLSYKFGGAQ